MWRSGCAFDCRCIRATIQVARAYFIPIIHSRHRCTIALPGKSLLPRAFCSERGMLCDLRGHSQRGSTLKVEKARKPNTVAQLKQVNVGLV